MRLLVYGFLVILGICCISCDPDRVYEKNLDLTSQYWHKDSLHSFHFEIPDQELTYNLYCNIRNTVAYPYHNLYFTYFLEDSLGKTITTKMEEIFLFDPKTGKPNGSGIGDIFDHQVPVMENYTFKSKGSYTFKMQQFMRMDSLPDILAIGLRVEQEQP